MKNQPPFNSTFCWRNFLLKPPSPISCALPHHAESPGSVSCLHLLVPFVLQEISFLDPKNFVLAHKQEFVICLTFSGLCRSFSVKKKEKKM